jgi:hypothetical protein
MKNNIFFLISLSLFAACSGGGGSKANSTPHTSQESQTLENPDGHYLAAFEPINSQTGSVLGALTLLKEGDKFMADIRLNNGHPGVVHRQNIYIGTSCPSKEMDVNQDGFIDIIEARPSVESILIPLDGDLNSQLGASDYWPISDQYGSYWWGKTGSYLSLMQDLWKSDENADDNLVKLNKDQLLTLVGKVVLIQGVAETTMLPDTVATMGRFNKFQTLPVACARITFVSKAPGVIDDSDELAGVSVPEGETVGGSSGAQDGAIDRYQDGGISAETTGGFLN